MAQTQVIEKPATYEDLLAVPETLVAEILFGKLVTHPRPAPRHAVAGNALSGIVAPPFQFGKEGPGGWIFMVEPELHFGDHVTVPDIAGWRLENLPELPDTAWLETPPDWLCEVLSPSTERYDRVEKMAIYAAANVRHMWFVDPRSKLLEAYELKQDKWLLLGTYKGNDEIAVTPFDAVSFSLRLLWPYDLEPEEKETE